MNSEYPKHTIQILDLITDMPLNEAVIIKPISPLHVKNQSFQKYITKYFPSFLILWVEQQNLHQTITIALAFKWIINEAPTICSYKNIRDYSLLYKVSPR